MEFVRRFNELNSRDVSTHVEKKNGLNYLSWAYVQQELSKLDPDFSQKIEEFPHPQAEGLMVPYLSTPEGYFVKARITLFGKTKSEWLPVLDFKNKSLPQGQATTFDINKAQKRAFVKCAAQFGLGLYLYLGEDAPDNTEELKTQLIEEIENLSTLLKEVKNQDVSPQEVADKFSIGNIETLSQALLVGNIKKIRMNAKKIKESATE